VKENFNWGEGGGRTDRVVPRSATPHENFSDVSNLTSH
jgi:hypothetical protein